MGKPQAPAPPDYAAAATAQGKADENAALGSNFLNQVNQSGPYGSLTYSYDKSKGMTLPDGTVIPSVTATTTLDPAQQKLLDQNNQMSSALNDLGIQGIGYVKEATSDPLKPGSFNPLTQTLSGDTGVALRDKITQAYMDRLQPQLTHDQEALNTRLANQGITQGSEAYNDAQRQFQSGVNDQRTAALLAGDAEQQNEFNRGLGSANFNNQARAQAIQEANYFQTQPLNILNALRTGNAVTNPQFGNVAGGASFQGAPIYQATADQYHAAMQQYQQKMASFNSIMGGLAGLGGTAMKVWG